MNDTPLPLEFISRIRTQFPDEAEEFITSLDNPPCTSIHIHPYKSSSLNWVGEKIPWFENGLIIKERPVFTLDPSFHAGAYYPQESSSMFIGYLTEQLFGSNKNITCLDFCAAPGGKSLVISDFIGTEGRIVSNEIHKVRNSILRENLIKWGVSNFIITQSHSEIFRKVPSFFDLVLVDAPCSGEGMFRKDINARSEWSPETIRVCSLRQKEILSDLIESIKPGGYLIYSTCTFAPDENEKNAEWMLTQGMLPVTLSVPSGWNIRQIGQPSFCGFQFLPHRVAGEGFFAVVFRKDEASQRKRTPKTGKRPYRRTLEKKEKLLLSDWVNTPDKLLIDPKGELHFSPFSVEELEFISNSCFITEPGLPAGQLIKSEFIPGHGLAMNTLSNHFRRVEVELDQALKYLKRESFHVSEIPEGWAIVSYNGYSLGWIKGVKTRINNYYPSQWRIRMR